MALEYPDNLKYLSTHEYIKVDGDTATIGISAYAINELGDIVFIELPNLGENIQKGESFGTIESVKAVGDLYSPITGTIIERNNNLIDAPETISFDPYDSGWLLKVKIDNPDELLETMSASEYINMLETI